MILLDRLLRKENIKRAAHGVQPAVDALWFQGIPIVLEHFKNDVRSWHDATGRGRSFMLHSYGYIPDTMGLDGDEIDVFVGPESASDNVFIVYQLAAPDFKELDEWKVMLGFDTASQATEAYMNQYDKSQFYGDCKHISIDLFIHTILVDHPVYEYINPLFLLNDKFHAMLGEDKPNIMPKLYIHKSAAKNCSDDEEELEKKYVGFDKLKGKLKGKVSNPGAVAAAIGRKKYGKKKFDKDAAKGKKMKNEKPIAKSIALLSQLAATTHAVAEELTKGTESLSKALTSSVVAGFSKRPQSPWKAPVAHEQGLPQLAPTTMTPVLKATPVQTDRMDVYKSCAGCGRMNKSTSDCPRCGKLSELNKSVSFAAYE